MSEAGGRIFFSNVRRSLETEDEIRLTSVGIDIGSSTSHLVFSRLVLERLDNRYVVSERKIIHESEVLLTPFIENAADDTTIDASALPFAAYPPDSGISLSTEANVDSVSVAALLADVHSFSFSTLVPRTMVPFIIYFFASL